MSARSQVTLCAQEGGLEEDVTADHFGSPERLEEGLDEDVDKKLWMGRAFYLIDVTSQPLATAYLHILEPRNPLPPHTIIFLAAVFDMVLQFLLITLMMQSHHSSLLTKMVLIGEC